MVLSPGAFDYAAKPTKPVGLVDLSDPTKLEIRRPTGIRTSEEVVRLPDGHPGLVLRTGRVGTQVYELGVPVRPHRSPRPVAPLLPGQGGLRPGDPPPQSPGRGRPGLGRIRQGRPRVARPPAAAGGLPSRRAERGPRAGSGRARRDGRPGGCRTARPRGPRVRRATGPVWARTPVGRHRPGRALDRAARLVGHRRAGASRPRRPRRRRPLLRPAPVAHGRGAFRGPVHRLGRRPVLRCRPVGQSCMGPHRRPCRVPRVVRLGWRSPRVAAVATAGPDR
jgi:hypothetical protein